MAFDGTGKTLVVGGQMTPVGAFANGTPGTIAFDFETGKKLKEISIGAAGDGCRQPTGYSALAGRHEAARGRR